MPPFQVLSFGSFNKCIWSGNHLQHWMQNNSSTPPALPHGPYAAASSDPRLHTIFSAAFQSVILMDSHRRLLLLSTKYLRRSRCVCLDDVWSFYCWCAFQRENWAPVCPVHLPIKGMGVVPSLGQWWVKPQKDTRIQFLDKYKRFIFLKVNT